MSKVSGFKYTVVLWEGDVAHGGPCDYTEFFVDGIIFVYDGYEDFNVFTADKPRNIPSKNIPNRYNPSDKASELTPIDFEVSFIKQLKNIATLKEQVEKEKKECMSQIKKLCDN
jgi:hypothetical protein